MPGFANFGALVEAQSVTGAERYSTWRKSPAQTTAQGVWFDLSMSPGNPAPQYYAAAPLVATQLAQSTDGGIFHAGAVSPKYKFLRKIMALTLTAAPVPMPMILCDYLLYYPFVDEGSTDEQVMVNTNTIPRYTDGAGVKMMAIVVGAHSLAAGVSFTVNYTNSAGVAGRTSIATELTTNNAATGAVATSARNLSPCTAPFLPLQTGDTGVRSVQGVTFTVGDVGLVTIVLVKPLAQMTIRGIDAPVEKDFLVDHANMPRIYDDAYLNFLCCPNGNLSGAAIHGDILTVWN